jgi:hypothetical protein
MFTAFFAEVKDDKVSQILNVAVEADSVTDAYDKAHDRLEEFEGDYGDYQLLGTVKDINTMFRRAADGESKSLMSPGGFTSES